MAAKSRWATDEKEEGSIDNDPSSNNSSGFTAFPSGWRVYDGIFKDIGYESWWWSSTEDEAVNTYAYRVGLELGNSYLKRHTSDKQCGSSVRCIKDY